MLNLAKLKIQALFSVTVLVMNLLIQEKDVRKWKEELLDQRRRMMEEKLLHAEFKREVQLQAIVKKAQEEEAKVTYFVLKGNCLRVMLVYVLSLRVLRL